MQEFLEGRTCLLTGASRGIGKSILNNLLEIGVNVIVTSKNESILRSICKDLTSFKSQIDIIPANLADVSEVNQLCQFIEKRRDNIDIIINNAGILDFRLLNVAEKGTRTALGPKYRKIGLREVLEAAKKSDHWNSKLENKSLVLTQMYLY